MKGTHTMRVIATAAGMLAVSATASAQCSGIAITTTPPNAGTVILTPVGGKCNITWKRTQDATTNVDLDIQGDSTTQIGDVILDQDDISNLTRIRVFGTSTANPVDSIESIQRT